MIISVVTTVLLQVITLFYYHTTQLSSTMSTNCPSYKILYEQLFGFTVVGSVLIVVGMWHDPSALQGRLLVHLCTSTACF